MNQKFKKNKGFSLIELLIAIAILAIIMMMISGFVTSTLHSQRKTKKDMQVQEEGQRVYSQLSDVLMQATYIRVESENSNGYVYDSASGKINTGSSTNLGTTTFVPDNYPNYQLNDGLDSRKIIVDYDDFQLYNEDDDSYPGAGSEIDGDTNTIKSFRVLTKKDTSLGNSYHEYYYVVPKYIYIEYSKGKTAAKADKTYAILKYDKAKRKLYMYRYGNGSSEAVPSATNNYSNAVTKIDSKISSSTDFGFLSENVAEFYLSANPDGNSVSIVMKIENEKYEGYMYNLKEIVNMRNSNVLTVKPQLLRKRKGTGSTTTP